MDDSEIDPAVEVRGSHLRATVLACLDAGRVSIEVHQKHRMQQRHVTALEIESTLKSGQHRTESCDAGKWRYRATKREVVVIFTFDVDDEGNLLVVVTTWRESR